MAVPIWAVRVRAEDLALAANYSQVIQPVERQAAMSHRAYATLAVAVARVAPRFLAKVVVTRVVSLVSVASENCSTSVPTGAVVALAVVAVKRTTTTGLTIHHAEILATVVVPHGLAFLPDHAAAAVVDAVPVESVVTSNLDAELRNLLVVSPNQAVVRVVAVLAAAEAVQHSTYQVARCIRHGQDLEDSFAESAVVFFLTAKTATRLASHTRADPVPSRIQVVAARSQRTMEVGLFTHTQSARELVRLAPQARPRLRMS